MIKAIVVEDSPHIAERIVEFLTLPDRVEVVAKFEGEDAALAYLDRNQVDLAMIDLQLFQGTGFGVIRRLREKGRPPAHIVVLTNHAIPALKVAAFEAGADIFLDKSKDWHLLPRIVTDLVERKA